MHDCSRTITKKWTMTAAGAHARVLHAAIHVRLCGGLPRINLGEILCAFGGIHLRYLEIQNAWLFSKCSQSSTVLTITNAKQIMSEPTKGGGTGTVEVVAPSNLDGGYEFFVNAGDKTSYKVRVPDGGVKSGERFHAVIVSQAMSSGGPHAIPSGRWRDGLCDCFTFGLFHPLCCLAFWCTPCALGQVLHRNKLNALGGAWSDDAQAAATSAFKILFAVAVISYILQVSLSAAGLPNLSSLVNMIVFIFCVVVTVRLRGHVRRKYAVPESTSCKGFEDCCCSFWCLPCTICQVSRHTADFRNHKAGCCSDNGLGPEAPDVV
jgi:Cys-rich protein (TIGR01571 family)